MKPANPPADPPAPATASVPAPFTLTPALVLLLATAAGVGVASLYYSQPMLGLLGAELGASTRAIGLVPTLTQLGYALGILFLAPLGDRFDRRRIILGKSMALVTALLVAAFAPSIGVIWAASLAMGVCATLAQDIVPAAATLAPEEHRGKVVGKVMTGLLLGILLSRVVSGLVAQHLNWRTMFVGASVATGAIAVAIWRYLPVFKPTTRLGYGALMATLATLWTRHPVLRRAAVAQALLALGFSAFWSTLAVMLQGPPFHLGSAAAGAFGLAGAAGALAAPLAGRVADRHGPEVVIRIGASLSALSFAAMAASTTLAPQTQLAVLALCAVGFDLGVQAALIAHQTIIYGIDIDARSRLNATLMVGMFIGMATGAALGSLLLAQWGWVSVTVMACASSLAALLIRLWPGPERSAGA